MGAGLPRLGRRRSVYERPECLNPPNRALWHLKCPRMSAGDTMPMKRLEKEEENQAKAARTEEDLDNLAAKDAPEQRVDAASEEMIEDDEVVNEDEDDLEDLEEEEQEAAEDAETSRF